MARISQKVKLSSTQVSDAGTTATMTLLAAVATKAPTVYKLMVSSSANDTFALKIGSTTVDKFIVLANTSVTREYYPQYLDNAATVNEAVTLTKTAGTTAHATMFYELEQV